MEQDSWESIRTPSMRTSSMRISSMRSSFVGTSSMRSSFMRTSSIRTSSIRTSSRAVSLLRKGASVSVTLKSKRNSAAQIWRHKLKEYDLNKMSPGLTCYVIVMAELTSTYTEAVEKFHCGSKLITPTNIVSINCQDLMGNFKKLESDGSFTQLGKEASCIGLFKQAAAEAKRYSNDDGIINDYIPIELTAKLIKIELMKHVLKDANTKKRESIRRIKSLDKENKKEQTNQGSEPKSKKGSACFMEELFFIVSGFYHPDLPEELWKTGVQLTGILEIAGPHIIFKEQKPQYLMSSSSSTSTLLDFLQYNESDGFMIFMNIDEPTISQDTLCSSILMVEPDFTQFSSRSESIRSITTDILSNFWSKLYKQLEGELLANFLLNTIHLRIGPNYKIPAKKGSKDYDQQAKDFFSHVSKEIAKITDAKRQHENYSHNMKLYNFKSKAKKTPITALKTYNKLMDTIPPECCTAGLLLHYLLEEVCARVPDPIKPTLTSTSQNSLKSDTQQNYSQENENNKTSEILEQQGSLTIANKPSPKELGDLVINYQRKHSPLHISGIVYHKSPFNDLRTRLKISSRVFSVHELNMLEIKLNNYGKLSSSLKEITRQNLRKCLPILFWRKYPKLRTMHVIVKQNLLQNISCILKMPIEDAMLSINRILFKTLPSMDTENDDSIAKNGPSSIFCGRTDSLQSKVHQLSEPYLSSPVTSDAELIKDDVLITLPPIVYSDSPNIYQAKNIHAYMWYEKLAPDVMLQQIEKANHDYIRADHHYCPFTDSIILRFHNNADAYGIYTKQWKESLRTRVGLRDFCKYTMTEEADWLRKEAKLEQLQQSRHSTKTSIDNQHESTRSNSHVQNSESEDSYSFYGYDLGTTLPRLTGTTTVFHSQDGYKVTVDQSNLIGQPKKISIDVNVKDNSFILHCDKNKKEPTESLTFHFSLADGTVIVFSKPPRFIKPQIIVGEVINKMVSKKRRYKPNPELVYQPRAKACFYTVETKQCKPTYESVPSSPIDLCSLDLTEFEELDSSSDLTFEESASNISLDRSQTLCESSVESAETEKQNLDSLRSSSTNDTDNFTDFSEFHSDTYKSVCPSDDDRFCMPVSHLAVSYNPSWKVDLNKLETFRLDLAGFVSDSTSLLRSQITSCTLQPTTIGSNSITATRACLQVDKSLQKFILNLPASTCDVIMNIDSSESLRKRMYSSVMNIDSPSQGTSLAEKEIRNIDFTTAELNTSTDSMNPEFIKHLVQKIEEAKKVQIPYFKVISSRLHKFEYIKCVNSRIKIKLGKKTVPLLCKHPHKSMLRNKKVTKLFPIKMTNNIYFNTNYYDLKLSLPSGLLLNTVAGVNYGPFQIKQRYIEKGPLCNIIADEDSRTFIRDGRIVIKKSDGNITVLCPNGQTISCEIPRMVERVRSKYIINCNTTRSKQNQFNSNIEQSDTVQFQKLQCHFKRHVIGGSHQRRCKIEKMQKKYVKQLHIMQHCNHPLTYTVVTDDGETLKMTGSHIEKESHKIFQEIYDLTDSQEYMYIRDDGTSCLLNQEGVLITEFPDHTRITTWFSVEPELVGVSEDFSWSDASSASLLSRALTNLSLLVPIFIRDVNTQCDGWVDINIHYKFEHPNYATVEYNTLNYKTGIVLPNKVNIIVTEEGFYDIDINGIVSAKITNDEVYLKSILCKTCRQSSITTVNIKPLYDEMYPMPEDVKLLQSNDTYEKVFFVKYSGACCRNSNYISSHINRIACEDHDKVEHQKLFALNRNLSGVKYWDVRGCHKQLLKATKDRRSVIQYYDKPIRHDNNHSSIEIRSNRSEPYYLRFIAPYEDPYLLASPLFRHLEFKRALSYYTFVHIFTLPVKVESKALEDLVVNLTDKQSGLIDLNGPGLCNYFEQMAEDCIKLENSEMEIVIIKPAPSNFDTPVDSFTSGSYEIEKPEETTKTPLKTQSNLKVTSSTSCCAASYDKTATARSSSLCPIHGETINQETQCECARFYTKKARWERLGLQRPKNSFFRKDGKKTEVNLIDYEVLEAKAELMAQLKTLSEDPIAQDHAIDCYLLEYCQPKQQLKPPKTIITGNVKNVVISTPHETNSSLKSTSSSSQESFSLKHLFGSEKPVNKSTATDNIPVRRLVASIKKSAAQISKFHNFPK